MPNPLVAIEPRWTRRLASCLGEVVTRSLPLAAGRPRSALGRTTRTPTIGSREFDVTNLRFPCGRLAVTPLRTNRARADARQPLRRRSATVP